MNPRQLMHRQPYLLIGLFSVLASISFSAIAQPVLPSLPHQVDSNEDTTRTISPTTGTVDDGRTGKIMVINRTPQRKTVDFYDPRNPDRVAHSEQVQPNSHRLIERNYTSNWLIKLSECDRRFRVGEVGDWIANQRRFEIAQGRLRCN